MKETIKKIEAAQRQLDAAITLWFRDGDSVAIHTLACSAYQIIHDINRHRKGRDLLLDSLVIKDEYRRDFISFMKGSYNFFKHAASDPDPEGTVEFQPILTELFILFSILGLELCGIKNNLTRWTFIFYNGLHNPNILTEQGRKLILQNVPPEEIDDARKLAKANFFDDSFMLWRRFASH